jgi:hypothetical protein
MAILAGSVAGRLCGGPTGLMFSCGRVPGPSAQAVTLRAFSRGCMLRTIRVREFGCAIRPGDSARGIGPGDSRGTIRRRMVQG